MKNRGSFVKGVEQNFPLFFTGQSTPLTKKPEKGAGSWAQTWGELEPESGGDLRPTSIWGNKSHCVRWIFVSRSSSVPVSASDMLLQDDQADVMQCGQSDAVERWARPARFYCCCCCCLVWRHVCHERTVSHIEYTITWPSESQVVTFCQHVQWRIIVVGHRWRRCRPIVRSD